MGRSSPPGPGTDDPVAEAAAASTAVRGRLVGVMGSARIRPGDPRYEDALRVGREMATAGFVVMTGGYGGLMEAVSRGAAEAGGAVIGLPVRGWGSLAPNAWIGEVRWVDSYFDRLTAFAACDAIVALDGGLGTLGEAAVAWANLQTDPGTNPPLVLFGRAWRRLHALIGELLVVDKRDLDLVRLVDRPEAVSGAIVEAIAGRPALGEPRG
jgi:uncharacterized protein (TIGR00725 family)